MSQLGRKSMRSRSSIAKTSTISRPSTAGRQSISRPSVSRQSVSRQSGISRQSSVGGTAKVDVKGNFNKNVKDILSFLLEREYPKALTKKNLTNPTEKTFKEVLKFILKFLAPDFECKHVSEDVIELLDLLSYPYLLKSSFFKPVGSPHTWPHLLEALNWLCGLTKMMEYESQHISKLFTFECKDEDEANRELEHNVLARDLYSDFNETGDYEAVKQKYIQKLNTQGKIEKLKEENRILATKTAKLESENRNFPNTEWEHKTNIDNVKQNIEDLKTDKKSIETCLAVQQKDLIETQTTLNLKREQLSVLKSELENLNTRSKSLAEQIVCQPAQHEVQRTKQLYNDLLHKKDILENENQKLDEENGNSEVLHSKHQRELREKWRTLIKDIKEYIPDLKYDYDRVIDNKSIVQAEHIIQQMKSKLSQQKEDLILMEEKIFKQKMDLQRLTDDERLSSEQIIRQKDQLSKMEERFTAERKQRIEASEALSKKLEQSQRSIKELEEQLKESQSPDTIEEKIKQEDDEMVALNDELTIYKEMMESQNIELERLKKEHLYNSTFFKKYMQCKDINQTKLHLYM